MKTMMMTSLAFAVVLAGALSAQPPGATAPAQAAASAPRSAAPAAGSAPRTLQLHRHAEPADAARYRLARRDDLDGRPRCDEGRQDDRHRLDRRIEPNGPWLALGKHNYVLKANCDAIARKLGNALCAPIVPFVPKDRSIRRTAT
jgi:hypothetical protein